MRRLLPVLAVVLLVGCGSEEPHPARVVVAPAPEGPSLAARVDVPTPLPRNPRQECRLGGTVTVTPADGGPRRYGPCVLPPSIERLRAAIVRAAEARRPPRPSGDWRTLIKDWYDGRVDGWYPCAVAREALRHAPVDGPTYTTVWADLSAYARAVCIPLRP
jgi:hypothetical protein